MGRRKRRGQGYRGLGNHVRHTLFAVVEANDYDAIHELFRPQGLKGTVEVLPVGDLITTRKDSGNWGK